LRIVKGLPKTIVDGAADHVVEKSKFANITSWSGFPPKQLLGGVILTPYPVFGLICTIDSELKLFPDLYR